MLEKNRKIYLREVRKEIVNYRFIFKKLIFYKGYKFLLVCKN